MVISAREQGDARACASERSTPAHRCVAESLVAEGARRVPSAADRVRIDRPRPCPTRTIGRRRARAWPGRSRAATNAWRSAVARAPYAPRIGRLAARASASRARQSDPRPASRARQSKPSSASSTSRCPRSSRPVAGPSALVGRLWRVDQGGSPVVIAARPEAKLPPPSGASFNSINRCSPPRATRDGSDTGQDPGSRVLRPTLAQV